MSMLMVLVYGAKKISESEKSILFNINDNEYWIPKSHIGYYKEGEKIYNLQISEWIANKKNLHYCHDHNQERKHKVSGPKFKFPAKVLVHNSKIIRESEKAILFSINNKEFWIPKKHILQQNPLAITGWITYEIGLRCDPKDIVWREENAPQYKPTYSSSYVDYDPAYGENDLDGDDECGDYVDYNNDW